MSLRLERAEGGKERAGGGGKEGVMCLPVEPSPWTGLSLGTGGVWVLGRLAGPRAACPAAGLPISLSVITPPPRSQPQLRLCPSSWAEK